MLQHFSVDSKCKFTYFIQKQWQDYASLGKYVFVHALANRYFRGRPFFEGRYGWFALGKNFSSKPLGPLVIEFFSWHTTQCKIISSSIIRNERYFSFQCRGEFFCARLVNNFLARIFFTQNQSAGYFFLKSPIPPPQKFNGRLIKLHQLKSSWCRVSWAIIRQGADGMDTRTRIRVIGV